MTRPFGTLRFLYVGSSRVEADLRYYRDGAGAEVLWDYRAFGARVAAVRIGDGPLLLLADHREAPSCLPVYEVDDLKGTVKRLRAGGIAPTGRRFEIPNGPCYLFRDPSGNEFALFEDVRPNALDSGNAAADSEGRR